TVEGGRPIEGTLRAAGNKNEALPVIAASLLVPGPVVLDNLPRIGDVETLLQAVRGLGADVVRESERAVRIDASGLASAAPDPPSLHASAAPSYWRRPSWPVRARRCCHAPAVTRSAGAASTPTRSRFVSSAPKSS